MFKNLGLAKKIGIGFGSVLAIAAVLGGLSVWNMTSVQSQSSILAQEYVPEVRIAGELERQALLTMYAMRGYNLSESMTFYEEGLASLGKVKEQVAAAKKLAGQAEHLVKLEGEIGALQSQVTEYEQLCEQARQVNDDIATNREQLDAAAATYMQACSDFLAAQNEALTADVAGGQEKIAAISAIDALGAGVRIKNFKGQATQDPELIRSALKELETLDTHIDALRTVCDTPEEQQHIDKIDSAAASYAEAITAFLAEYQGDAADAPQYQQYRQQMDTAAATFARSCGEFLDAQQAALGTAINERHRKITLVNEVVDLGNATRVACFKSQALRQPQLMVDAQVNFDDIQAKLDELRTITRRAEDVQQIDTTDSAADSYQAAMNGLLSNQQALATVGNQREQVGRTVLASAQTLAEGGIQGTTGVADAAVAALSTASTTMIVGLIVALALGTTLAVFIARGIIGPVRQGVAFAQRVADGDFTERLQIDQQDEIGVLANALNGMAENLQQTIKTLTSNAQTLAHASTELSATASQLASGAEETTAQSASVSAAAEEMSTNMQNMAGGSQEMSENVRTVASAIEEMTASIAEVARNAEQAASVAGQAAGLAQSSNDSITQLGEAADAIGKVIETIQDIAEQTNLLALNATIEAARAGDAGKGFAVVANEVKALARQTAEATEDIRRRIEGIQRSTSGAVSSIGEITGVITQVNDVSRTIASAVEEQSSTTKEIARNVAQSASGAEMMSSGITESAAAAQEITRNITGVDQAARQAAAGAAQTQTASQDLARLGEELQQLVQRFKV